MGGLGSRKIAMRTIPRLPCTFRVSKLSCLTKLGDFGRKLFCMRSIDSVLITRATTPGGGSCIVSIYTTPKKGDARVTRLLRKDNVMRTESLARCGISLVQRGVTERKLSGVGTMRVSTAISSPSSRRGTSILIYSLPYSKLNIVKGGASVHCGVAGRGTTRLTGLRERVLSIM